MFLVVTVRSPILSGLFPQREEASRSMKKNGSCSACFVPSTQIPQSRNRKQKLQTGEAFGARGLLFTSQIRGITTSFSQSWVLSMCYRIWVQLGESMKRLYVKTRKPSLCCTAGYSLQEITVCLYTSRRMHLSSIFGQRSSRSCEVGWCQGPVLF